jgi:hypothetical protein
MRRRSDRHQRCFGTLLAGRCGARGGGGWWRDQAGHVDRQLHDGYRRHRDQRGGQADPQSALADRQFRQVGQRRQFVRSRHRRRRRPVWRGGARLPVVARPTQLVAENVVGFAQPDERRGVARNRDIGMQQAGLGPKGRRDRCRAGSRRYAQQRVITLGVHEVLLTTGDVAPHLSSAYLARHAQQTRWWIESCPSPSPLHPFPARRPPHRRQRAGWHLPCF